MGLVGKHPNKRARVKMSDRVKTDGDGAGKWAASQHQVAVYIAEICGELGRMAKANDLLFLCHLLSMAQAEAEDISEIHSSSSVNSDA